jgi:hypothetical protein
LCAIVKCVKIEHSYFDYVSRETYMKVLCIADSTRVCNCSRVLPSNARTYMFQTNDKWRLVKFQLGLLSETIIGYVSAYRLQRIYLRLPFYCQLLSNKWFHLFQPMNFLNLNVFIDDIPLMKDYLKLKWQVIRQINCWGIVFF